MEKIEAGKTQYQKLKDELQREFNENSPLYFAFGRTKSEVIEALKKEGANVSDLIGLGNGAYIEEKDVEPYIELTKSIRERERAFLNKSTSNLCGAYLYHLWNFEARISLGDGYDEALQMVLDALGKTLKELNEDELKALIKTEKYYNKKFDEIY